VTALETFDITVGTPLRPDWLPACTRASLRYLSVAYAALTSFPEGLVALQELHVTGCDALEGNWLPACSAAHVHTLGGMRLPLTRLPPGLHVLTRLECDVNSKLQEDFDRRS
jgi:hypothetical protein